MIQDIFPHKYNNVFKTVKPQDDSIVIICIGQRVMCSIEGDNAELPTVVKAEELWKLDRENLKYLFKIDGRECFLSDAELPEAGGFAMEHVLTIRGKQPMYTAFAAAVGSHLARWYANNIYCGRCGGRLIHAESQRALKCPACSNMVFPRINPIIIVGVTDGDKLLVAKYNKKHFNTRNDHYVLLAGYCEIGESYEDTLRREVREETGLEVSDIHYVGSQPWPFSDTSIAGFYAHADSTLPLKRQEDELSELKWVHRDELPPRDNRTSITDNLIEWFRHGMSLEDIAKERSEAGRKQQLSDS